MTHLNIVLGIPPMTKVYVREKIMATYNPFIGRGNNALWEAHKEQCADIAEARERELLGYCSKINDDVSQTLGKALGYPWYKDFHDFPDATEANGVCVGDHVAESIAVEAANKIKELQERMANMIAELRGLAVTDTDTHPSRDAHFKCDVDAVISKYEVKE
jgi:hypothetical protein